MPKRRGTSPPRQEAERVLALDVSSVCVGFAVFVNGRLSEYGRYQQEGKGHGERLLTFGQWLRKTFKQYAPDHVVVERPYPGAKKNVYGILSQYIGVVVAAHFGSFREELPDDHFVTPTVVKRVYAVGKGNSHDDRKAAMVQAVNLRHGLNLKFKANDRDKRVSQDDTADAIALGDAWLTLRQAAAGEGTA